MNQKCRVVHYLLVLLMVLVPQAARAAEPAEEMKPPIWRVRQTEARYGEDRAVGARIGVFDQGEPQVKLFHAPSCRCYGMSAVDCLQWLQEGAIVCDADVQPLLNKVIHLYGYDNSSLMSIASKSKSSIDSKSLVKLAKYFELVEPKVYCASPSSLHQAASALEQVDNNDLAEKYRQFEIDMLKLCGPKYELDAWTREQELANFRVWRAKQK